ncbi:MAG: AAA-like domain-containing protein, partial [Waterburya sp.]
MINICIELNWKTALQAANALILQHTGKYLSDIQIIVLHGAWNNDTYAQIAEATGYTSSYLCKDIGHNLWQNLSTALKVRVSKRSFKAALRREWQKYTQAILNKNRNQLGKLIATDNITLFEGLIALDSTFYLERCLPLTESFGLASRRSLGQPQTTIETACCEEILKPGSLIRIEGAKWMGKTSLVNQILGRGNLQVQRTV